MEQRDYITRQIEQIGAMISHMLRLLSGSGKGGRTAAVEVMDAMCDELGLNIDAMVGDGPSKALELLQAKGMDYDLLVRFCSLLDRLAVSLPAGDPMRGRIADFSAGLNRLIQETYSIADFLTFHD